MRTAVVLFNLGGPDSLESVRPFLYNLFSDKAILGIPAPIRQIIATMIAKRRAPIARDIYSQIGDRSPILPETQKQANAIDQALSPKLESAVFISMRYWHPLVRETIKEVEKYNPDRIILLPLYPQFSSTTTGSSFKSWWDGVRGTALEERETITICSYPNAEGFIAGQADLIDKAIGTLDCSEFRLLMSAHGLPEKNIKKGDPYQEQVELTAKSITEKLNRKGLDWVVCYQSKVGPLQWIKPSTESEIRRAVSDDKALIIVPIAFVSEHSETLVELDIEYKELAIEAGAKKYIRVPALGDNKNYISSLVSLIENALSAADSNSLEAGIGPNGVRLVCPQGCSFCVKEKENSAHGR
tara:strand:- start:100718 stop:101785 length:1068 start_codon:yes stop_codon:yes gene_type:complete